jgi:hypothetical protein
VENISRFLNMIRLIDELRSNGLYTPPSLCGIVIYPFTGGGVNWGAGAFDPKDDLYIVNTINVAHVVRLIPRAEYAAARAAAPGAEIGPELGAPYAAERTFLFSIFGVSCNPPPWGTLAARVRGAWTRPFRSKCYWLTATGIEQTPRPLCQISEDNAPSFSHSTLMRRQTAIARSRSDGWKIRLM